MLSLKIDYDVSNAESISKNKLKKVLMKSMYKMEELAVDKAPKFDGELQQKITLIPEDKLSDKYELQSNAKHSAAMEYGTRPFWAPIKPLKKWARKKLKDEKAAYAVRAKIAKEGIDAQPFMRPSLFDVRNYWVKVFFEEEK